MIQHRDIPDAERHEPKGISSALDKEVYISTGSNTGDWRRIVETDISFSDKTKNVYGWIDVADSLYTTGSPRAITSGTRTQITNNGLKAQTDTSRLGTIWNTTDNQLLVNDLNAVYVARINFKVKAAGPPYVIKVETESSNGNIVIAATDYTIKGGSYENSISHTVLFYVGATINNFPLKFYITPDTNISLYDTGFVIQRTYKET